MSSRRHSAGRQPEPGPVDTESGPPAGWVRADDGSWAPPADPDADGGEPDPAAEQTTDYTRAGGHVLTDYGWVPEDLAP